MIQQSHFWVYIPKENKISIFSERYLFIAALFMIAKIQRQPKPSLKEEWMKEVFNGLLFSLKKKEILLCL